MVEISPQSHIETSGQPATGQLAKSEAVASSPADLAHNHILDEAASRAAVQAMQSCLQDAPGVLIRMGRSDGKPLFNEAAGEA